MPSSTEIPIVFIHIWKKPPPYLREAVRQARAWNPGTRIVCISSVIEEYGHGEEWVAIDDIPIGEKHTRFRETTALPGINWDNGFWQWTTERIFVLEDWMRWAAIEECFHMENDNMLYQNISEVVPLLRTVSPGISTTCHSIGPKDTSPHACFSVLYCRSIDALSNFLFYLAASPSTVHEMERGGIYWDDNPEECSYLPTAPVGMPLSSEEYRHYIEDKRFTELGIIFEAAAHGQYLGGCDPNYMNTGAGYMNPACFVRADQYDYMWHKDELGRRYPTIKDTGGKVWKIANLHIHCKRLADFSSYNHSLC